MQGNRDQHTLGKITDNGAENRLFGQTADLHHLGDVLMTQRKPIVPGRIIFRVALGRLILGNHLLAAAGIAGQAVSGQGIVRGENAHLHQGIHQGDKARGMAAGIGHKLRGLNLLPMGLRKLREAVSPGGVCPVGSGSVNDPGAGILYHFGGFHGRSVRQAQEDIIRLLNGALPGSGILFHGLGKLNEGHIVPKTHPALDLETGGSGPSVNKNLRHWFSLPS